MQQLTFIKPGKLEWWDVPEPDLQSDADAIVRPLAVARCDLDTAILHGLAPFQGALLHFLRNHLPESLGQKGMFKDAPFKGPYAFGHEFVGELVAVGDGVKGFAPGQKVIVPFQISCGECSNCRRGITSSCTGVPARSMYGFGDLGGKQWGGALSDLVRVPFANTMLLPVPDGIPLPHLASIGDNVCDGFRTVGPFLKERPESSVLVVGGGAVSVGLYAAAVAVAMKASKVDYLDTDPARLAIAKTVGANPITGPYNERRGPYAITVDASANPDGLTCALLSTEPGGVCTSVGIYYTPKTAIPLRSMYGIGVTFITGRVNSRACLPTVLDMVCCGSLRPEQVTTRVSPWNEAPDALLELSAKVIITR